ncbi:hypothetical protein C8R43DRAFT_1229116 [Mycena crocata]|nr:hypothetical protein C8R43DRAFT_1229116 [Mycena crocata]
MSSHLSSIARKLVHNDLPFGRVRLVFMVLTLVFSIVAGGLCLKIWTKQHTTQNHINDNLPSGTSAVLEYKDVKTTSICLFVANHLVTFTVSHIVIIMLHDILKIIPPFVLRRLPFNIPTERLLSSVTLPYQAAALLFSTVCLLVASVFHTLFVFTHSGTVAVHQGSTELPTSAIQGTLDKLGVAMPYRDVYYIRISAELPWPTIFFALGANIMTLAAWYKLRRTSPQISSLENSISENGEVEKSSAIGEDGKDVEVVVVEKV